ncbi:hypothetical protein EIP91_008761 [Steccherinum ochraceum]|uniref:Protein kinase domain-containing protein n=1 Tax=Steccherinum ochraceum TaxID=92696 RepID=A0A4R0R4Q3_9APHY|nr:hypothetical protein EIP91_008761 [Steccherinum ochraceum]
MTFRRTYRPRHGIASALAEGIRQATPVNTKDQAIELSVEAVYDLVKADLEKDDEFEQGVGVGYVEWRDWSEALSEFFIRSQRLAMDADTAMTALMNRRDRDTTDPRDGQRLINECARIVAILQRYNTRNASQTATQSSALGASEDNPLKSLLGTYESTYSALTAIDSARMPNLSQRRTLRALRALSATGSIKVVTSVFLNATHLRGSNLAATKELAFQCCRVRSVRQAMLKLAASQRHTWGEEDLWGYLLTVFQDDLTTERWPYAGPDAVITRPTPTLKAEVHTLLRTVQQANALPSTYRLSDLEVDFSNQPAALGAFGTIYRGTWLRRHSVAVKVVHGVHADVDAPVVSADGSRTLIPCVREIILWYQLDHPHVHPLLGVNTMMFESSVALVSRWEAKGDVNAAIRSLDIQRLDAVRPQWIAGIADGLHYLHSKGIVHGDLRGANILVDENLQVRLTDFGLAVLGSASAQTNGTVGGVIPAQWQATELFLNQRVPTFECDVFSFGRTCVEIFKAASPFGTLSSMQVLGKVIRGEHPNRPISDAAIKSEAIPDSLWDVVLRCWEVKPEDRPDMRTISSQVQAAMKILKKTKVLPQAPPADKPVPPGKAVVMGPLPPSLEEDIRAYRERTIHELDEKGEATAKPAEEESPLPPGKEKETAHGQKKEKPMRGCSLLAFGQIASLFKRCFSWR